MFYSSVIRRILSRILVEIAVLGVMFALVVAILMESSLGVDFPSVDFPGVGLPLLALFGGVTFAGMSAVRLDARGVVASSLRSCLRSTMRAGIVSAIFAIPVCYAYAAVGRQDFGHLSALALLGIALMPLSAICVQWFERYLVHKRGWQREVVVIGEAALADRIRGEVDRLHIPIRIAGFFDLGDPGATFDHHSESGKSAAESLNAFLARLGSDDVVVATRQRRVSDRLTLGLPMQELMALKLRGVRVVDLTQFIEQQTGRMDLDTLCPAHVVFTEDASFGPLQQR